MVAKAKSKAWRACRGAGSLSPPGRLHEILPRAEDRTAEGRECTDHLQICPAHMLGLACPGLPGQTGKDFKSFGSQWLNTAIMKVLIM